MDVEVTLHNLKIVSMVNEWDKLSTGVRYTIRSPSTMRSPLRMWFGETRAQDAEHLRLLFAASVNIFHLSTSPGMREVAGIEQHVRGRIEEAIQQAAFGVKKLMTTTYREDSETCARLELLLQETNDRIRAIQEACGSRQTSPVMPTPMPVHDLDPPSPFRLEDDVPSDD